jgi:hypothetical protein
VLLRATRDTAQQACRAQRREASAQGHTAWKGKGRQVGHWGVREQRLFRRLDQVSGSGKRQGALRITTRSTRARKRIFLRLAPLRLYRNFARVVVPWACDAESESICRSALKGD